MMTPTERIRSLYRAALAAGIWGDWYADHGALVEREARAAGVPLGLAAGALALLSPRVQWSTAVRALPGVLQAHTRGEELPWPGLGSTMRACVRFLETGEPSGPMWGPKVRAFYRALLGDRDAVVVDVWSARAALGKRPDGRDWSLTAKRIRDVEDAHRLVALEHGTDPVLVQARVWELVRGAP